MSLLFSGPQGGSLLALLDFWLVEVGGLNLSLFFFLRFYLFIHRDRERERQRHREKQAPCREPDVGLDPGSPGSRPGLQAALNRCATWAARI